MDEVNGSVVPEKADGIQWGDTVAGSMSDGDEVQEAPKERKRSRSARKSQQDAKIGDVVWYILRERDGLRALPAILHEQRMDGTWALNYFREGNLVYISHVAYCGSQWRECEWCWPGEENQSG